VPRRRTARTATVLLLAGAAVLPAPAAWASAPEDRTITVSAASSLVDVMTDIARRFERTHPGVHVRLNFGSSGALATQLVQGAPVDVFASASDSAWSDPAIAGRLGNLGPETVFARNRLVVVVPRSSPIRLRTVRDIRRAHPVAMCVTTAPCGELGDLFLRRSGVRIPESDITRAADARATLAAVTHGDAEAAIVYRTDARSAGRRVRALDVGNHDNVEDQSYYNVGPVLDSARPELARAFCRAVRSRWASRLLVRAGFMRPPTVPR
jgi:molybdate transport system substrate-binding protein